MPTSLGSSLAQRTTADLASALGVPEDEVPLRLRHATISRAQKARKAAAYAAWAVQHGTTSPPCHRQPLWPPYNRPPGQN